MICQHCGMPTTARALHELPGLFDPETMFHHVLDLLVKRHGAATPAGMIGDILFNGFEQSEISPAERVRKLIHKHRSKLVPYGWQIGRAKSGTGYALQELPANPALTEMDRVNLAAFLFMQPETEK